MFKNYLKTAWRNLRKNKFYAAINITGLTIGLAVGILILLWVQDELSFDRFHARSKNIFKLENRVGTGSSTQIWQSTVAPIGPLGKDQLPDIQDVVRLSYNSSYALFRYKDKVFNEEKTLFADGSLFSMFDFPLIKGNKEQPFADNHSIVITASTAARYFGTEDPIGKVLVTEDKTSFKVTGVINDLPKNSTIQGDMFLPMSQLNTKLYANNPGGNLLNDFRQFNYTTFLLLKPGTSPGPLTVKLRDIHLRNKPDDTDILYMLAALPSIHLYHSDGTNGGIETVKMFSIIALLILVIACINYVNLSTARSMLRSKEISLRKIVGAGRMQLFMQFIIETALLFLFATILAVSLIWTLVPSFNEVAGKQLAFNLSDYNVWLVIGITILATLAASSIYPALLLSSFEPLKALKGKIAVRLSDAVFRKILVVTQFSFSIVLIAGTIIISRQLGFIRNKALGYDKNHVLSFDMRGIQPHYEAVKASLLNQPGVLAITRGGNNIVNIGGQTGDVDWDGKQPNQTMMVRPMAMDDDFISFFKIGFQQGEGFTGTLADSGHLILNETAVKEAGIQDPIGKKFRIWKIDGTIVGVVKDFHVSSMKNKIEPAVFYAHQGDMWRMYIKTTGNDAAKVIAAAEQQWKQFNAGFTFNYAFLDDTFNSLYQAEERTGKLFNLFAGIAILISCLGLFGLAAFTAQLRTREIGVRKVIGASVASIIRLLAKDFIKLVLVAIVIAVPVAWYVMSKWLEDFAYKVKLDYSVFVIAGLGAIVIAVLTISFQSVKAALANPVKSLRTE
jgi:putative ABC transport system permease protein